MTEAEFLEAFNSKDREFEMFTKAGNKKCQAITKKAIKKIFGKKRITEEELLKSIGADIKKATERFGEIRDSEPPYHIKHYVVKALKIAGYDFYIDSYSICKYAF